MSTYTLLAVGLSALLAYLIGSISFAVIVSKVVANDDVRLHGSKNAGMTNILRTYGKVPAFFTFMGDFIKGMVAVLIGRWLFEKLGVTAFDGGYVAGFFALLGHLFPLYFHFKGGKGVLTSLGIMLIVNPWVFLVLVVVLLPFVFITRIVSLISIIGAVLYPFVTLAADLVQGNEVWVNFIFSFLFSLIVIYKHKENIGRLLNGTEKRFGENKDAKGNSDEQNLRQ